MKTVDTKEIMINPFSMIEDGWFLITVKTPEGRVNAMTAASGTLGHMFRKNVAYINIRNERYTHELLEHTDLLSLCFFTNTDENKEVLRYLGTTSGRDVDKILKTPFTVDYEDGIPYFTEAEYVFICRTLYKAPYISEGFIDKNVEDYYYPKRDYHDLYVVDIMKTLVKG